MSISVYNVSARWRVKTYKFTLFVYCNFLVLLSTSLCSQNIFKQNVNIADETLTDYSVFSRYHHNKSKNYLKRRYRIHHWIPMFIGTPCIKIPLNRTFDSSKNQSKLLRIILEIFKESLMLHNKWRFTWNNIYSPYNNTELT